MKKVKNIFGKFSFGSIVRLRKVETDSWIKNLLSRFSTTLEVTNVGTFRSRKVETDSWIKNLLSCFSTPLEVTNVGTVRSSGVETRINFTLLLLLVLFTNCNINATVINKDSLKSKYDINDPRNPNCPCHKYQKQADEEYKEWLKKQAREQGVTVSSLDKRDDKLEKKSGANFFRIKTNRKSKAHPRFKKLFDFKRYKFWHRITQTDACFHW